MQDFILSLTKHMLKENLKTCGFKTCDKLSVGGTCVECSRFVCLRHGYLRVQVPPKKPQVVCAACILLEHEELFEKEEEVGV